MGNPVSPTLANIVMCKLEEDVVTPKNLPFHDGYVHDCFTKRKTNAPDTLLENLNSYHPNTKFTVEEDPDHFLDTSFEYKDGKLITKVYQKPGKLQVHWKSAIPERWKRNTILRTLHRAKQIATNWQEEVKTIRQSFIKSRYPAKFVNDVIQDFDNLKSDEVPVHWFDDGDICIALVPWFGNSYFQQSNKIRTNNKQSRTRNTDLPALPLRCSALA